METLTGLCSKGRLMASPVNIKLGWKKMVVPNTLAYYNTAPITAVKSFIVQAPAKNNAVTTK